jgi:hypothetical protein
MRRPLPLMLLMTCRDDQQEMAPQVRDQLAELPTAVRRVSLPPLGVAEVADLAAISLGQELPRGRGAGAACPHRG